jgi:hypothetical protein
MRNTKAKQQRAGHAATMRQISHKGKKLSVRSLSMGSGTEIIIKGRLLKTGEIFDEIWARATELPDPLQIVTELRKKPGRPDLLTFIQKLPDISPKHPFFYEQDNLAVATFGLYSEWYESQIDRSARKQIKQAAKAGVRTEVIPFTADLVKGICAIYNELPVRQGRKFWHYGKDFETVKAENSAYLERSIFIGAFYDGELVGFIKIVFDEEVAALMQIISKSAHFAKRPNNALLSKAVEVCAERGVRHLTYGRFEYSGREHGGLAEFKRGLGFKKVDIPRYYVPLTLKGRIALRLKLHHGLTPWLPSWVSRGLVGLRARLFRRFGRP